MREEVNKNVSEVLETSGKAQKTAALKAKVDAQKTSPAKR